MSTTPRLLRPSGTMLGDRIWPVAAGYDRAAATYDRWYWQDFWQRHEVPVVLAALRAYGPSSEDGARRPTAARALDAGTGSGLYFRSLRDAGFSTVGLDVSAAMLARARENLGPDAELVHGSVERCPFADGSFDVVVACRVLSHVADLDAALAELARVTRAGGRLVLTDVSARHKYATTRIPTPDGDVHIETFKHRTEEIVASAQKTGSWELERMDEVYFRDLVASPLPADYPSIDSTSSVPIFFRGVFLRVDSKAALGCHDDRRGTHGAV